MHQNKHAYREARRHFVMHDGGLSMHGGTAIQKRPVVNTDTAAPLLCVLLLEIESSVDFYSIFTEYRWR